MAACGLHHSSFTTLAYALTFIVFSFVSDLTWMKITLAVWGYGVGTTISLYILLMPKYMGLEKMPAIFGAQSLMTAAGNLTLGPLIGKL